MVAAHSGGLGAAEAYDGVVSAPAYPGHLVVDVVLRDGSTVHMRPARPEDAPRVEDYFIGLSEDSRHLRFWSPSVNVTEQAQRTVDVDHVNHLTLLAFLGAAAFAAISLVIGARVENTDVANGWMDIGTTNLPWARETPRNPWTTETPQLPLFKITCNADVAPHAFLGRVIYTQDPGRALISGKCNDVGAIVMQQFRGLAARAPYFSNGSAATLRELVDFYDRRYDIGYSEQEKQDLVAFLSTL